MFNDAWVEVGWTPIDYLLRHKPSYYALSRAFRPVKVIAGRVGRNIVVRAFNESPNHVAGEVEFGWFHVAINDIRTQTRAVDLAPFSHLEIARLPMPSASELDLCSWVFGTCLESPDRFGHTRSTAASVAQAPAQRKRRSP